MSRCSPNTRAASRVLIPSTMQARRTRTYSSTLYILHTFHRVALNSMEGGGWYSFAAPLPDAHPRLAGTLLLRPLQITIQPSSLDTDCDSGAVRRPRRESRVFKLGHHL